MTVSTGCELPSKSLLSPVFRLKVPKSQIVEAAIFRRLDRLTHPIERLEGDQTIAAEAVAHFVKFWLTTTPPLPDTMRDAAQAKGRERYEGSSRYMGGGWRTEAR